MAQIEERPDWYPLAVGQADRAFGDYVYRLISRVVTDGDWSTRDLGPFQAAVAQGVDMREKIISKLDGLVAIQKLSVEPRENDDAVHGVQSKA
jgi:hypothetical protein